MNRVNEVSGFCAVGLPLCYVNPSPSICVEILLHSENVRPSSSVAPLTLGSLSFFFSLSDLDCISRAPFCCRRLCNASQAQMGCNYHNLYGRVYISTKAWLGFLPVSALPVITKSSLIKHNPFSEEWVSSPLPGPVLACDNTDKSMLGFLHIKAVGVGRNGGSVIFYVSWCLRGEWCLYQMFTSIFISI